jgi:hypothetical protein
VALEFDRNDLHDTRHDVPVELPVIRTAKDFEEHPMARVLCSVTGVYGTIHTTGGNLITEGPERIAIDCEMILFYLPVNNLPFSGTITTFTLHFGTTPVEVAVPGATKFRKGDKLTVVMPVSMAEMVAEHPVR